MKKQIINRFLIVLALGILCFFVAAPSSWLGRSFLGKKFSDLKVTLGLDLAGGTELNYKIDLTDAQKQNIDSDPKNDININALAESVRDSLEKRVNPAGIGEIVVKRSQMNGEEYIIIQMPPSSNIDKAKQDAEQDNRLEFFEENPNKAEDKKTEIRGILKDLTPDNWDEKVKEITDTDKTVTLDPAGKRFKDDITDQAFAEKLFAANQNTIVPDIVETKTDAQVSMGPDGKLQIVSMPQDILAIVRVKDRTMEKRDKTIPAKAHAHHILIAYKGATKADNTVTYTKEEAQKKAQEILDQLKKDGTENFGDLAKQYSTEPAAKKTGGDLGEFESGKMTPKFNDAVFAVKEPGLLPNLVETEFGYHIVEVLSMSPEKKDTVEEPQVDYEMLEWKKDDLVWDQTELGGKQLENAMVGYNEIGQPLVNLYFNPEGGDIFTKLTEKLAAEKCGDNPCRIGIKVGGKWVTQPTVREKISGRNAQITGNFTPQTAKDLANSLNLGAIDAPIIPSGQMTITPELGQDQLVKSLKAGIYGFIVTVIFMTIMYRFSGFIASIALGFYIIFFVTILKVWPHDFGGPIVLTLPGIAGVVLSIGMAVDGNVLIFERTKEEFLKGKLLKQALDLGFERAWPAIRDSQMTTLLTCMILFSLGSSIMKGFAITLIIGTILSMFTAITVSRTFLRFILIFPSFEKPSFFAIHRPKEKDSSKDNSLESSPK